MNRIKAQHVRDSVKFMLDHHQIGAALPLVQAAAAQIRQTRDWRTLREIWEVPQADGKVQFCVPDALGEHSDWRTLIGRILSGSQDDVTLSRWLTRCQALSGTLEAELVVLHGYVLLCQDRHAEVVQTLTPLLPELHGYWLGLAHQRLLWAKHRLHLPWDSHLAEVRRHLSQRSLGSALLDASICAYSEERDDLAHELAVEALSSFKGDIYHLTWTNLHLGFQLLRSCRPEAELHFTRALQETKKAAGRPLRAKALAAVAAYRRLQGEFQIALEYYRRAATAALAEKDLSEHTQILINSARTLRLAGRTEEALTTLEAAAKSSTHRTELQLERVAAQLRLGKLHSAQQELTQVTACFGGDAHLKTICDAEVQRLSGNSAEAHSLLSQLPLENRVVREEVRQFPTLFTLLASPPTPLEYRQQTVIQVQRQEPYAIRVNGRTVHQKGLNQQIKALLYLMAAHPNPVPSDEIFFAVTDFQRINDIESSETELIQKLIKKLRHLLEYPESIQERKKGRYSLDHCAVWLWQKT